MKRALLLFLVSMTSPSCQAMMYGTASRLNDISVGMPKTEAVEKLGTPDSTYAHDGVEFLIYKWMKTTIDWWPKYYYVKLIDGKVNSYGEQKELQQRNNDEH
jgi:hypothetical protein